MPHLIEAILHVFDGPPGGHLVATSDAVHPWPVPLLLIALTGMRVNRLLGPPLHNALQVLNNKIGNKYIYILGRALFAAQEIGGRQQTLLSYTWITNNRTLLHI